MVPRFQMFKHDAEKNSLIIAKKYIHDAPVIFNDYAYAVFIKKGRKKIILWYNECDRTQGGAYNGFKPTIF